MSSPSGAAPLGRPNTFARHASLPPTAAAAAARALANSQEQPAAPTPTPQPLPPLDVQDGPDAPCMSSPPAHHAMAEVLFSQLDADGDGWLVAADLALFIEEPRKLDDIWAMLDPDAVGRVDLAAFERCFHMFAGGDDDDEEEAEAEEEEQRDAVVADYAEAHHSSEDEQHKDMLRLHKPPPSSHVRSDSSSTGATTAAGSEQSSASSTLPALSPSMHKGHSKKSVSFGFSEAPSHPVASPRSMLKRGNTVASPSSRATGERSPALRRTASQRLQLKKGYASLKHALILDELRSAPVAQHGSAAASPSAAAASPSVRFPSSPSASAAAAPSTPSIPASPSTGRPGPLVRQHTSTDYAFHYSKSHTSLMQRARKILNWCEDPQPETETEEGSAAGGEGGSATSSNGSSTPKPPPTISISELETTVHYLARSLTPDESSTLSQLMALHGVSALPLAMFREVIQACVEQEEQQKGAIVREAQKDRARRASLLGSATGGASSPTATSALPAHSPPLLPTGSLAAAREFDPDAFTASFLSQLSRRIELVGVKLYSHTSPSSTSSSSNALAGALSPSTSTAASPVDAASTAELELQLSQLRQQHRSLESETRALRSRYDVNLIFTKQLEAENFSLRTRVEEVESDLARKSDMVSETSLALDAHKSFILGLERKSAALEAEVQSLREQVQQGQAMLELERKRGMKLQFELEKSASTIENLQHIREGSSRALRREAMEEMKKNMGVWRFQRQMIEENARVAAIEQERIEAIQANKALQDTIAEQQRILNQLQREKLAFVDSSAAGGHVRGDLTSPQRNAAPPLHPSSTPSPSSVDAAAVVRQRSMSMHDHGSLGDELADEEEEEAKAAAVAAKVAAADQWEAQYKAAEAAHASELETIRTAHAQQLAQLSAQLEAAQEAQLAAEQGLERRHSEQLDALRAELEVAQGQLQSSRTSRLATESALSLAEDTITQLEQSHKAKDASLAQLSAELTALKEELARADGSADKVREELTQKHEAELAALKQEHERAMEEMQIAHDEQMRAEKERAHLAAVSNMASQVEYMQQQRLAAERQQAAVAALQKQLSEHLAHKLEYTARVTSERLAMKSAHEERLAQVEAEWSHALDAARAERDAARLALRTAESSLLQVRQQLRDHVCTIPSSVAGESALLQASLAKAQSLSRALEQQVVELQTQHVEIVGKMAKMHEQLVEAKTASSRRETDVTQAANQAALEAQAELTKTRQAVATLEAACRKLQAQNDALQSALRQSKSSHDEVTLQLQSLQSHAQSDRESSTQQIEQLNKLVEHWQSECEKRKAASEAAKREVHAKVEELEALIRTLEHTIATHSCASGGSMLAAGSGMGVLHGNTATPMLNRTASRIHSSPPVVMPVFHLEIPGVPSVAPSPVSSPVAPPPAAPMGATLPAFAESGLSSAHVLEIHAYASFITSVLGDDPELRHVFPLDLVAPAELPRLPETVTDFSGCGVDLLRKLHDGLVIAKLINVIKPYTIDERVLNKRGGSGGGLHGKQMVENLNVCVTSAKALGITMRIPQDVTPSVNMLDTFTGVVVRSDGRRLSMSLPPAAAAGEEPDLTSVPSLASSATTNAQYVGVELGDAQLKLMCCDTTLEDLDITLDFLFQLLRLRMLHAAFGPEARKISRLAPMLRLPKLAPEMQQAMLSRTVSLLPGMDAASSSALPPALGGGGRGGGGGGGAPTRTARFLHFGGDAHAPQSKSKGLPAGRPTLSRFQTLSRALPANLSSQEHKRFVANFNSTVLGSYEATSELNALTPEQLLLRWINWALMQQALAAAPDSAVARSVHFVAHWSDMDVTSYALLLAQVDRWRVEHGVVPSSTDASLFDTDVSAASSASVLSYLTMPLAVPHFHSAASVATRHERLNQLLLALLFQEWPMMNMPATPRVTNPANAVRRFSLSLTAAAAADVLASPSAGSVVASTPSSLTMSSPLPAPSPFSALASPSVDPSIDEEGEASLLKSYLNSFGIPGVSINHLFHDVRNGLTLLRIIDWLEPRSVDWKHVEMAPNNKFKCIANLNMCLQLCRDTLRMPLVNIGAVDLYAQNNGKYVLAITWQLLRYNTIAKLKEEWANLKVSARPHPIASSHGSVVASSWSDASLRSSLFLLNLLDNMQEGCVDWSVVEVPGAGGAATNGSTEPLDSAMSAGTLLLRNARYCISVARKLGAEIFAQPSDIVSAHRKQLVLMLASLMATDYNSLTEAR